MAMEDREVKELNTLLTPATDSYYWRAVLGNRGWSVDGRHGVLRNAMIAMLKEYGCDRGQWVHKVVLGLYREVLPIAIGRTNPAAADRFRAVASMSAAASLAYECRRDFGDWRCADQWWTGAAEMLHAARSAARHAQQAEAGSQDAAWWSWAEAAKAAAQAVRDAADVLEVRYEVLETAAKVGLDAYKTEGQTCQCGRSSDSAA